jgi:cob(I)alamin adenosyltransferase
MAGRSIATRTGDGGTTGLVFGQRVSKDHPQIEAVGTFDELNAALGLARATCGVPARSAELERIQRDLVALMGELACAESDWERYEESTFSRLGEETLARLDAAIAEIESAEIRFDGWATPGATLHAAALDLARTVARRAERRLVALPAAGRTVRPVVGKAVNRIADLLWLMAREAERPEERPPGPAK